MNTNIIKQIFIDIANDSRFELVVLCDDNAPESTAIKHMLKLGYCEEVKAYSPGIWHLRVTINGLIKARRSGWV